MLKSSATKIALPLVIFLIILGGLDLIPPSSPVLVQIRGTALIILALAIFLVISKVKSTNRISDFNLFALLFLILCISLTSAGLIRERADTYRILVHIPADSNTETIQTESTPQVEIQEFTNGSKKMSQ